MQPGAGTYGSLSLELGQAQLAAAAARAEDAPREEGPARSSGAKVTAVILAVLAVLLTALTVASSDRRGDGLAAPPRLQAGRPGTEREGDWQDMIPAQWRPKVNGSSSGSGSSSGRHGARNCTAAECTQYRPSCNATFDFVCVDGFAVGGCAQVKSAWEHPGCEDYCTLAFCPDDDAKTGDGDADAASSAPAREGAWEDLLPKQWRPKVNATATAITSSSSTTTTTSSSIDHSSSTSPSSSSSSSAAPHHGAASGRAHGLRNCTLTECEMFHCNATNTVVCVDGYARGGCAATEAAWQNPGCNSYCSLKYCKAVAPKCAACSDADCHRLRPVCGSRRQYACTEGPSNGGCAANATYWPGAVLSGQCLKCCDLSTCGAPLECSKSCTPFECQQVGFCPRTKPFACTKGAAFAGCGTEDFWEQAEFNGACQACCDTSSCP